MLCNRSIFSCPCQWNVVYTCTQRAKCPSLHVCVWVCVCGYTCVSLCSLLSNDHWAALLTAASPSVPVQAHDSFRNPRQSGGEAFTVQVQGVARDCVQIKDRQDGTYLVEYCVPAEGTYQACVTLHGAHVAGSPATITAFRSGLCLDSCWLHAQQKHTPVEHSMSYILHNLEVNVDRPQRVGLCLESCRLLAQHVNRDMLNTSYLCVTQCICILHPSVP